ncbi:MAG: alpha/beta hydrolase [Candidatus Limiplasma sp.]|nr:alpha/beta hydrolase [Candidatus Limiplasma sp.]
MIRQNVQFVSQGLKCTGWFYRASSYNNLPCIIMAPGFGGVKEKGLSSYAAAFAEIGYHVLVFDYRHFGESEGEPRYILDIPKQLEDWHAAIGFARETEGVDSDRIILWGTSFSGGHVVSAAVKDGRIAAVISQVPNLDGRATAHVNSVFHILQLTYASLRDNCQTALGNSPFYVKSFGNPGELAAMTAPGTVKAFQQIEPVDYDFSGDAVAGRVFLNVLFYSPGRLAGNLTIPWLVQIAQYDQTTPISPAIKAAMQAPKSRLIMYKCGHFEMYIPPFYNQVIQDQLLFLKSACPVD